MTEEKKPGSFECKENQPTSLQESTTVLGEGAYSTVRYYTDDNDPTKKYIGKSLTIILNRSKTPEDPLYASMVQNELNLLLKLKDRCEEVFLCLDRCFVSMKSIEGGRWEKEYLLLFPDNPDFQTLDSYAPNLSQWTFREKIYLCQALAEGLEKLHSLNIIHRDIKPENILIKKEKDNRLEIKYIDYGLSCIDVKQTTLSFTCLLGVPVGTPGYQPPEQTIHSVDLKQSDTWSLGIVFYFIWNDGNPPVWERSAIPLYEWTREKWAVFVQRYCNSTSSSNYACLEKKEFDHLFGPSKTALQLPIPENMWSQDAKTNFKELIQYMTSGPIGARPFISTVIDDLDRVLHAEKRDRDWEENPSNWSDSPPRIVPLPSLSPRKSRFIVEDVPLSPRGSRFIAEDVPLE